MGLTNNSTGNKVTSIDFNNTLVDGDVKIAFVGNPNVGKSTLFNELTGMNQHTGNWPGKTVTTAIGHCEFSGKKITIIDLPGTYSLNANSPEEEITGEIIRFSKIDCIAVICDATCLERNLSLAISIKEMSKNVILCINLLDEAELKGIKINFKKLSEIMNMPIIPMVARKGKGIKKLLEAAVNIKESDYFKIKYPKEIETAIDKLVPLLKENLDCKGRNPRWMALKLLEKDKHLYAEIDNHTIIKETLSDLSNHIEPTKITDAYTACSILTAEYICGEVVTNIANSRLIKEEKTDKILTGKFTSIPIMLGLLFIVFWLTISGSNYPSKILGGLLFEIEDILKNFFEAVSAPEWLSGIVIDGAYRVLASVVSVMLPPMAIFFPLFTILEDLGYLPRVAFNMDYHFKKANTCGKQALTMCMGFGCNAAGVVGCRIIDSPRESLIAVLTNNFVPCNGRFPTLIAIISMFLISGMAGFATTVTSALFLLLLITVAIIITLLISKLLSATILKGVPSSFALEMPPFRRPQVGRIIVRSIFDRTIFVLSRAVIASIPAGILIWLMANLTINDVTLLKVCSDFLNPTAKFFGLDGVIMLAFILGFPANEIVIPIILMAYMGAGSLVEYGGLAELKHLLISNGWTTTTAISTMIFCLFHWPCATTLLTIKKETASLKWTFLSFLLPTLVGLTLCFIFNSAIKLLSL